MSFSGLSEIIDAINDKDAVITDDYGGDMAIYESGDAKFRNISATGTLNVTGSTTLNALSGTSATFSNVDINSPSSSSTTTLTVTNQGSGNSLVVNDSLSDTSPFIIDGLGNVGIGRQPTSKLDIIGTATSDTVLTSTIGKKDVDAGENFINMIPTTIGGQSSNIFHRYRSSGTPYCIAGTMFSRGESTHTRIFQASDDSFTIEFSSSGTASVNFSPIMKYNLVGNIWNLTGSLQTTGSIFGPGSTPYSLTSNGGTVGDLFINSGGSGKFIAIRPFNSGSNDTSVEFDANNTRVLFRSTAGTGFACFYSNNSTFNLGSFAGTQQPERLFVAQNNFVVAKFKREGAGSAAANILFENSGGTTTANQCVIGVDSTSGDFIISPSYLNRFRINTAIIPFQTNVADLGNASIRFRDTFLVNAPNVSSDANLKQNISSLDENDTMGFINRLRPVRYQLIDGQSGRYHHGLIAQELKQAIQDHGLTTNDVASYVESEFEEDGEVKKIRAIRYEEIISMLISTIQNLDKRVKILENTTV